MSEPQSPNLKSFFPDSRSLTSVTLDQASLTAAEGTPREGREVLSAVQEEEAAVTIAMDISIAYTTAAVYLCVCYKTT